jgi:hypothetical protein
MLFLMMLSLAWAEDFLIRVVVDDRQAHRLENPVIQVGEEQIPLKDDGEQTTDLPNDQIFVGQVVIQRSDSVSLKLLDQGVTIGSIDVSVPERSERTFQLKTTKNGLVLNPPASNMSLKRNVEDIVLIQAKALERNDVPEGKIRIFMEINASEMSFDQPIFHQAKSEQGIFLLDDGSIEGDTPEDQVWFGVLDIAPTEFLEGSIFDGNQVLGRFKIALPSTLASQVILTYNSFGFAAELNAQDVLETTSKTSLMVSATPKGEETSSADNTILLTVYLDDRLLNKLEKPLLSVSQEGVKPVFFQDDGSDGDESAGDHVLVAKTLIARSEYAQVIISDKGQEQGQLRVFLPSTAESVVWLRTSDNGVKLLSEPTSTTANSSPTEMGATGQASVDRLAHVLWVGIALFGIAFAYVRRVVFEKWTQEIKPVLVKLEGFVEKEKDYDTKS